MIKLKLYASECAMNEYYITRIEKAAAKTGCECSVEHISEEKDINRRGIEMPCLFDYCPGCHANSQDVLESHPDAVCTPALEYNGRIIFKNEQPTDEALLDFMKNITEMPQ